VTDGVEVDESPQNAPRLGDLMRIRAFRVLFTAEMQSILGDQLARVALSILVFARTGSAAATAATYAATVLPAIAGGYLLGGLGDRFPRRAVMIGADLVRGILFAVMALPGMPLWALLAILVVAVFLGPAFSSAEASYLADALDPEAYRSGTSVRLMASQTAQVVGFAVGGVVVDLLQPRGALLIDAVTYLVSALVVRVWLHPARHASRDTVGDEAAGSASGWATPAVRRLLALSSLAGFFAVPEALAVPFAAETGGSPTVSGFLLGAVPLGGAAGALLVQRVSRERRSMVAALMAIGCGLPLAVTMIRPSWPLAIGCWALSGLLAAFQVEVISAIAQAIPAPVRSQGMGIVGSILLAAQGVGFVVFGQFARIWTSATAVGIAGLAGFALAVICNPLRTLRSDNPALGYFR
jgi:predicted MFS family arabinose efflux permease